MSKLWKRIKKQTELTDLIGRADAMGAVQEHFDAGGFNGYNDGQKMMTRIMALPSAETHEIRSCNNGMGCRANIATLKVEKDVPEIHGDDCDGDHREVWEYDGFEYFGETEPRKRKLCSTCKHRTPHVAYDTCDIDGHVMGQFEILKRCCDRWEEYESEEKEDENVRKLQTLDTDERARG